MKRLFIYSMLVASSLGAMTSCSDFLDVKPVGAVSEEELLNQEGVNYAITGMYSSMLTQEYFAAPLTNYAYGDVLGGSANKGSTFTDQSDFSNLETYAITTDNGYLNTKWKVVYEGVYRANNVINMIDKIKDELSSVKGVSKDFYTEAIAQARFFRGFWHFEGMKLFGAAIPYVGSEEFASDVNPKVSNVDESGNYIYIWDKVAEDLQFAYDNLPDIWASDKGRVNKWAAAAFLAKLRLYQSSPYNGTNGTSDHWADAKALLKAIIANGQDNNGTKFKLADTYEDLFTAGSADWSGESVFDIQRTISGSQVITNSIEGSWHTAPPGGMGTSGWGFYQPSYELVNSHIVDESGLPYLDKSYQDKPALTTLTDNIPHTDLEVFTDPRLDISTGRFDVPYWDWTVPSILDGWVRDIANGGPYMNKKRQPKKADKGGTSVSTETSSTAKNYHLIRYADVLLWYAEVLIHDGNYKEAGKYINEVRARAANSYVKGVDAATMLPTSTSYVLDDKVNGKLDSNAAANYRVGLYPDSQFNSKDGALAALRFERKLELAMEGHRWYDLARWGIAYDEISNYITYEKRHLGKFANCVYNAKWVTLPIPNDQIVTMEGVLVQNENWK